MKPIDDVELHPEAWIADYAAGRLESGCETALETHLVSCDRCFAVYVANLLFDDEPAPAHRSA